MDPLSFTASLFAVIGGAKAGAKALRKIANYRHAPKEIAELLAELERFQRLLQQTITLVDEIDEETLEARGEILAQEVAKSGENIDSINRLLSEPNAVIAKLNDEKQAKAIWMTNKNKITAVQRDLKDSWVTVNYALGILTASSVQSIRQSINTSNKLNVANAKKLASLMEKLTVTEKTTQPPDAPREDDNTPNSHRSPVTPISGRSQPTADGDEDGRSWQITRAESRRCKPWCSCCCHSRRIFITPCLLTSILGHFVLEYASTGATECNERSCVGSKASSLNFNYNLPRYISAHFLSLTMDYTPLTGTQFSLRIPRVMHWDHLLWMYANHGNIVAIQRMFSEGEASPLDINLLGETALNYAAQHPRLYQFLVEQGANQELADNKGYKPNELIGERLLSAEVNGEDAYTINKMLDETDFMETRRFTILHKIVLGIVKRSLKGELEISTTSMNTTCIKGRTPLAWAVIRDDFGEVATLLDFGANPNICDNAGDSCLHFVRSAEMCVKLLEAKANVHLINRTFGASCIQSVCKRFDGPEVIELLHKAGADINFQDDDGESALMNAIWKKHTATARRLIELGADVNAANKSSRDTPLHFAVSISHHKIIPMLLEHGADCAMTMIRGATVAHMAAQFAEPKTIKALAAHDLRNMNLSIRDSRGLTAEDYLNQRNFFAAPEADIRDAFGMLLQSIEDNKAASNRSSSASDIVESEREVRLPGSYPT